MRVNNLDKKTGGLPLARLEFAPLSNRKKFDTKTQNRRTHKNSRYTKLKRRTNDKNILKKFKYINKSTQKSMKIYKYKKNNLKYKFFTLRNRNE